MEDAVIYKRGALIPDRYRPYPFCSNVPEGYLDQLRSIVAIYRFRHRVEKYQDNAIDFSIYMYVPELDPTTGDIFHEREDHCHILKRIWKDAREGGPDDCDITAFDAATMDPGTGLTHAALTRECKQSVADADGYCPIKYPDSCGDMVISGRHSLLKQWLDGMRQQMVMAWQSFNDATRTISC